MISLRMKCFFLLTILQLLVLSLSQRQFIKIGISKPKFTNTTLENETTITPPPKGPTTATTLKTIPSPKPSLTTSSPSTSQSSSATEIAMTTAKPEVKKPNQTRSNNSELEILKQHNLDYFCSCDLSLNVCDIGCCCDIDCSNEMMKVFDCSKDSYMSLDDFQFENSLPSCKINEGWLCVFKDNSKRKEFKTFNANLKSKYLHAWKNPLLPVESKSEERSFYKVQDPILFYDEKSKETFNLDLPFSLVNPRCQVTDPIRHLISFNRTCLVTWEEATFIAKDLSKKLRNAKIVKYYKNIDVVNCTQSKDDCLDVTLYNCNESPLGTICYLSTNSTLLDMDDLNTYFSKMSIRIHHNLTNLLNCSVLLTNNSLEATDSDVWLTLEVKFLFGNESEESHKNVSGPLGYLLGSSVIRGVMVPLNNSLDEHQKQMIVDYFHPNWSKEVDHQIFLPGSFQGDCFVENKTAIHFGENIFSQCYVRLKKSTVLNSSSNFTEICQELQTEAFKFLINSRNISTNFSLYVSQLGFPRNESANWIRARLLNIEPGIVNGSYNEESATFSCQNMAISVKYEFLTAAINVDGIPHQNIIKQMNLDFENLVDLQFKLNEEDVRMPIVFSVMFYDLTDIRKSNAATVASICQFVLILTLSALYVQF